MHAPGFFLPSATGVSTRRWLVLLGLDGLLLALLWCAHWQPTVLLFALGSLLTVLFTLNAWAKGLRQLWLARRVRKVFGCSIDHLRPAPLPPASRLVSVLGAGLVFFTLLWTGQRWLAAAYGTSALLVHYVLHQSTSTHRR